jgi:hypothetical protein
MAMESRCVTRDALAADVSARPHDQFQVGDVFTLDRGLALGLSGQIERRDIRRR